MARSVLLPLALTGAIDAQTVLLQDTFNVPGDRLNRSVWTTETGPPSFLGRTQLAGWITPGGIGKFEVSANGAQTAIVLSATESRRDRDRRQRSFVFGWFYRGR